VILEMRNVAAFVRDATQASGATAKVGAEAETAGKKAESGWKGLAKWAAGAGLVYGATRYIKDAVSATEDLAKQTIAVQAVTGQDTKTSSEWVGALKERGVSTRQFLVGMKTLSKQMETASNGTAASAKTIAALRTQIDQVAAAGGKKAPAELAKLSRAIQAAENAGIKSQKAFAGMGISMDAVRKGNTKEVLLEVADALSKMKNPAERTAAAQALLGRAGISLLPVLMKGRSGIDELLKTQERYGNYIDGKGSKGAKTLLQQQRELSTAWEGAKVQLGQALVPALTQVSKLLIKLAQAMQPLTRNATAFKVVMGALTALFLLYKTYTTAATIAETLFNAELTITDFLMGGAIVLAIVAVVAGFVLLYKKVGWFRAAVNDTWSWIKSHWLLLASILTGPIAVAVVEIVKHWGQVKAAAIDVWNWIKKNWPLLVGMLFGPFGLAVAMIATHFDKVKKLALEMVAAVKKAIQDLLNWVKSIPDKVGSTLKKIPGVGGALGLGKKALSIIPHPHLQEGGLVTRAGGVLVGERGPELLSLPAGAAVSPLPQPTFGPVPWRGQAPQPLQVVVPVYLDGREIARSTAQITSNMLARR